MFSSVRDLARKELSDYLDKYAGTKVLVWDEGLTGAMDMIAHASFFTDRSVIKMIGLKGGCLPKVMADNIIFLTRPNLQLMDKIADNVKNEEVSSGHSGVRIDFHILFLPQKSLLCEMRLKDRGVYGSFTFLDELSISWFPLDADVVSMEKPEIFSDFHLKNDQTCLHEMAKAMMSLQALYGFAPTVYGKGDAAKKLFEYMMRLKKEMASNEPDIAPQIDTIIILDRKVDCVTPFLTQLTYEGLIDELFQIKNGKVKITSSDKFASEEHQTKVIKLDSNDELYAEIRDKNFNAVGPTLTRKAKSMSSTFEERHGAKTVQEFKQFVQKLPHLEAQKQSIATHISIAEMIKEKTDTTAFLEFLQVEQELINNQNIHKTLDFIEDAACQEVDLMRLLRIICLQCALSQGLKPRTLETYRKVILQAYGHVHLTSLIHLEQAKLLYHNPNPSASSPYSILRKRLNLTQDDVNALEPNDISYVHHVYAPMSIRLVQNCAKPGWRAIREILDLIPAGPSFEEYQNTGKKKSNHDLKRTLVVFIGGCTFAEISALRFLSQQEDAPTEYLVATSSIITGNSFLESLMSPIQDQMSPF